MPSRRILIIEDDSKMRNAVTAIMKKLGHETMAFGDGESGLKQGEQTDFDLAIVDLKLPGINGLEVLRNLKKTNKSISVIMITAYATIDSAVEAMKAGAEDYLPKPFNLEQIRIVVNKVLEKHDLRLKTSYLQGQLGERYGFGNIVGKSSGMKKVMGTVVKVADSRTTILILGETGTGKELVARAIHFNSPRERDIFLPVNCGALSDHLLDSELFGHVKGAFTGAVSAKRGLFEVADGGTIFLDEIGDINLTLQKKLLRVLEEGEIQPVGGTERIKADVRVVAATNSNLERMIGDGRFREDLYYRLNVVSIEIPPLRERKEDIKLLTFHFLSHFCKENHKAITSISPEAMDVFMKYDWPGNVRELRNVIERVVLLETSDTVTVEYLPERLETIERTPEEDDAGDLYTLEEVSRRYIKEVLDRTDGNKTRASKILGINRTSLWRIVRRLKLE